MTSRTHAEWVAFYSSKDPVINSRIGAWPEVASFHRDWDWLTHDTDRHLKEIARLVSWYIEGMLSDWVDGIQRESLTKQERDEIVWRCMAEPRNPITRWDEPWRGGRPRTFAEIGQALKSGTSWDAAWGDWLHEFVFMKDARCLDAEPPNWFTPERRALMAGTAEFFARLYGLPKPEWVEMPEYFLTKMEYLYYLASHPDNPDHPDFMCWPPHSDDALYRMMARTPKEMLRRNVVYEARSLTIL